MVAHLPVFYGSITWYNGGCLICGRNSTTDGEKVGVQCVDLENEVELEGALALCYDCAIQVGRAVGMVLESVSAAELAVAENTLEEAEALWNETKDLAAQARLDRDTVERLVGPYYVEPPEPELVPA